MLSLGVILGILATICWGTADFFVVLAVKKTSPIKAVILSQSINVAFFLVIFVVFFKIPVLSFTTLGLMIVVGAINALGYFCMYKGFQSGGAAVASPIANCWPAVTVLLAIFFLGEFLTPLQGIGVCLAIFGAILVSIVFKDIVKLKFSNLASGAKFAFVAMFAWGICFAFYAVFIHELGWILAILLVKMFTVTWLLAYSKKIKTNVESSFRSALPVIIMIGILESLAMLTYSIAVTSEFTALIAPIIAAVPAVTVILTIIVLKEKIAVNQIIGIIAVISGLILLSVIL